MDSNHLRQQLPLRQSVTVDSFQIIVSSLDACGSGDTVDIQIETLIRGVDVIVFGRKWCPFFIDSVDLLTEILQVRTHVMYLNDKDHSVSKVIVDYLQSKTSRLRRQESFHLPAIFVKGQFLGSCEELMRYHHNRILERDILRGLVNRARTVNASVLDTALIAPMPQSEVALPLLLFPSVVNNHVSRVTSLFVFVLSIVGAAFFYRYWERYIALVLMLDFSFRFVAGEALSPLSMLATLIVSLKAPNYAPGVAKQLDAGLGVLLSLFAIVPSFLEFHGHGIIVCILLSLIAILSGLEGFFKISCGSLLIEPLIKHGILPPYIYRVYNFIRPELVDTFNFLYAIPSGVSKPIKITTDRTNPAALRYKKKTAEWKRYDWDPIRHMHVHYLFFPLSLAALAMAFKISADSIDILGPSLNDMDFFVIPDAWFSIFACFGAFILVFMLFLFLTKVMLHPQKLRKERTHPLRGTGLATIPISFMIFSFLCYDEFVNINTDKYSPAQVLGRVFFWIGSVSHTMLSIAAVADWIARPFTLETIHSHWLIYPIGLGLASATAPVVLPLPRDNPSPEPAQYLARFFFSFSLLLWLVLFTSSFLKTALSRVYDNRVRHGVWFWLACPCILGMADFFVCFGGSNQTSDDMKGICSERLAVYYFAGISLFMTLVWSCAPHIRYLSVEPFNMWYWIDCFCLGILSACAGVFFVGNGLQSSAILEFIFLIIAAAANFVALMHTMICLLRKHTVCTPEPKLSPLSYVALTHEAMQSHTSTLQYYLQTLNLDNDSKDSRNKLHLFAAHFNQFRTAYLEHARQEDSILYKAYRDLFPDHGKKWSEDHQQDTYLIFREWSDRVENILDPNSTTRTDAMLDLKSELPSFFDHLSRHFRGESENMDPIYKKHFPVELQKQFARDAFTSTSFEKWDIIIPYVLTNLPRHEQRLQYLKALCWAIPERSQQIGAIAFRHIDSIMWRRLSFDFPDLIPRGVYGWRQSH